MSFQTEKKPIRINKSIDNNKKNVSAIWNGTIKFVGFQFRPQFVGFRFILYLHHSNDFQFFFCQLSCLQSRCFEERKHEKLIFPKCLHSNEPKKPLLSTWIGRVLDILWNCLKIQSNHFDRSEFIVISKTRNESKSGLNSRLCYSYTLKLSLSKWIISEWK